MRRRAVRRRVLRWSAARYSPPVVVLRIAPPSPETIAVFTWIEMNGPEDIRGSAVLLRPCGPAVGRPEDHAADSDGSARVCIDESNAQGILARPARLRSPRDAAVDRSNDCAASPHGYSRIRIQEVNARQIIARPARLRSPRGAAIDRSNDRAASPHGYSRIRIDEPDVSDLVRER